jgi:hypothetical protein
MRGYASVFAALLIAAPALAVQKVNTQEIINRSVQVQNSDWESQPGYNFTQSERDDNGPTNTYRVMMILGSRYRELIQVNGQPLSPARQAEEEQKLQQATARRQRETPSQHAQRVAKYKKNREEEHVMLQQMAKAFDFHLVGEQTVNGHPSWVFDATPRRGYQPPNQRAKVLTGMRGRLWVAKDSYHWVRVEAKVVNPVTFEGFLARVDPGTRFEMQNAPVNDSGKTWEPSYFAMSAKVKILAIIPHNSKETDRFWDYHPAGSKPSPTVASR